MSISVVIVEDHKDLREGLARLVQSAEGLQCVGSFAKCEHLIHDLDRIRPDVALMDIGLPGMSGIEGVRELKARMPSVQALMLTIHEDDPSVFESICAGASGYLLKRTPPPKILEAIRELHEGGVPMSARVARRVLEKVKKTGLRREHGVLLSDRELEILASLVEGMSYKMIADAHSISIDTVRSHIKNIYEKLHVHSKSEAVAKALKEQIL